MNNDSLSMRFYGSEDLSPTALRAKELGELITALEDAVVIIVRAHDPEIKREQIAVSLTSVVAGSIALAFSPTLEMFTLPAAKEIVAAFAENSFHRLPISALGPLRHIINFVRKHDCTAEFRVGKDDTAVTALITPESNIETFFQVAGDTEIYCDVIRVGGIEPRVVVRTVQGDTLYCDTSIELAKQLADHLYESVRLYGNATWDFDTYAIKSFQILKVFPHKKVPITEAFQKLQSTVGDYFDQIRDVNQWVSDIREDEDLVYGDNLLGH